MKRLVPLLALTASALTAVPAGAGVVINEIFYHAPDDIDTLQWIELHNPESTAADLSGWSFSRGLQFRFPPGTTLSAGGYLVLCRDAKVFGEFHEVQVAGEFHTPLRRGKATLELVDAAGRSMDIATYEDRAPWPTAADGASASLERITPGVSGERAENWSASPLAMDSSQPMGSPGRRNATFSANLPPVISQVTVQPRNPAPGQPIRIEAAVQDVDGLRQVQVRYQTVSPGTIGEEKTILMTATDGRTFRGEIPGLDGSHLLRLRIRAVDGKDSERQHPSPNDLVPAISLFVQTAPEAGGLPKVQMIHANRREFEQMERVRARALSKQTGPFETPVSAELVESLSRQLDLLGIWHDWSLATPLEGAMYRTLRPLVATASAERNKLLEETMATRDPGAFGPLARERAMKIRESLLTGTRAAAPGQPGEALERILRKRFEGVDPGPVGFLRSLFHPEGAWLALNLRFELTDAQLGKLRPIFLTAIRDRDARVSRMEQLMRGEIDFLGFLGELGSVQSRFESELGQALPLRQRRFIQAWKQSQGSFIRPRITEAEPRPPRGSAAFIHTDPATGETEVFDFVQITERSAGYKVHFPREHLFRGMTAANVIFEYQDRFALAEALAFEVHRRAGNAACLTDFVRLTLNGHPMGYHLLFEQVNSAFLRRNRIPPGGDLYKLLWYGLGVEGQHEKQDHPDRDHSDLTALLDSLGKTSGDAQWEVIRNHFNVDQVATYFAVNMVLSHWDGFFNNYFTYHDRTGSGKWEMYPWDQDKTWGFHDQSGDKVFFDMPLTFGMAGDRPPGGGPPIMTPEHWWRPGGFFSNPLLANPQFRKVFLRHTRRILDEVYTEKVFFPILDQLATRLRPEIPIRARALGESPDEALARLDRNVASLKEHLVKRREFLLKQEELLQRP